MFAARPDRAARHPRAVRILGRDRALAAIVMLNEREMHLLGRDLMRLALRE